MIDVCSLFLVVLEINLFVRQHALLATEIKAVVVDLVMLVLIVVFTIAVLAHKREIEN